MLLGAKTCLVTIRIYPIFYWSCSAGNVLASGSASLSKTKFFTQFFHYTGYRADVRLVPANNPTNRLTT
jgi:hypothetical protein